MAAVSDKMDVFRSKSVVLVTGASQAMGAAFAKRFAELLSNPAAGGSVLVLTSRSAKKLETVRNNISKLNDGLRCVCVEANFAQPNVKKFDSDVFSELGSEQFDSALVVHNAAQLGGMDTKVAEMCDVHLLQFHMHLCQDQFNVNVVSMLVLNSLFWRHFATAGRKIAVNMTAPSAFHATPSFAMTSMVKSSRKILLNILAKERPDIEVLHFDPISVDSSSLRAIRDGAHSVEVRAKIGGLYDGGKLLSADFVANALAERLSKNAFESGDTFTALGDKKIYSETVEKAPV